MSDYEVVDTNAENIDGCSFCGRKTPGNDGYRRKSDWLTNRYPEGLRLKGLRLLANEFTAPQILPGDNHPTPDSETSYRWCQDNAWRFRVRADSFVGDVECEYNGRYSDHCDSSCARTHATDPLGRAKDT